MKRLIPPKTKASSPILGKFTARDLLIIIVFLAILTCIWNTTFAFGVKIAFSFVFLIITGMLLFPIGDKKGFDMIKYILQFISRKKKFPEQSFKQSTDIKFYENGIYSSNGMYYKAIEISGIDFAILTEYKQDRIIDRLGQLFKNLDYGKIVKLDKPINIKRYVDNNIEKGVMWAQEKEYASEDGKRAIDKRLDILSSFDERLAYESETEGEMAEAFYLILSSPNVDALLDKVANAKLYIENAELEASEVSDADTLQLFELFYKRKFDDELELSLPSVKEKWNKIIVDDEEYRVISIGDLPIYCINAWGSELFAIPDTIVSMNFEKTTDIKKVYKMIDRSIINLTTTYNEKGTTESLKITIDTQIQSLQYLLEQLKSDNEQLHLVNVFIMTLKKNLKTVESYIKDNNIGIDELYYRQLDAYQSMMLNKTNKKNFKDIAKNFQSTTLSAIFPFTSKVFLDEHGDFMGYNKSNRTPVYFDLFDSWKQLHKKRSNANMAILGTSGKGKSFFCKKLLLQQACNGVKIFVLDPEDEYRHLSNELYGNWIDIGGTSSGIINPLHVFESLQDDSSENSQIKKKEVSAHRQFLMEFFSITMPNLDKECRAFLNQAIASVYEKKNITDDSNISSLKATDFPTMQDIYETVCTEFEKATLDYDVSCYRKLKNELQDFAHGGVHSELWNGATTLTLNNLFTTFNFQSLLANSNKVIADGQMLLVMRFLMQEVIKNKLNNEANGTDNNILVLVDEAHQFINEKFPVALNFMAQMAKRIRKYGGSLIVATQSIKDFIGNEESAPQATAVINCCQYTTVFGLNPKDMDEIEKLYAKAGGLTDPEKDALINAETGEVLMFIDPTIRINMNIDLLNDEVQYMEKPKNA